MPHRAQSNPTNRLLALCTAAAAVAIAASSCTAADDTRFSDTSQESRAGSPVESNRDDPARTPAAAVDYVDGAADLVPQLAALRALDPCALLDPEAGAHATGAVARTLAPDGALSTCELRLVDDVGLVEWILAATVGTGFDEFDRANGSTTTIEGLTFYTTPPTSGGCQLTLDTHPDYGISLKALAMSEEPSRQPCDVARTYLKSAAARWTQLPQRADNHTAPQLSVAAVDPCSLTATIAAAVSPPVETPFADPHEVHGCVITATDTTTGIGGRDDAISVVFELVAFDAQNAYGTPVTVAGRPGSQRATDGAGCELVVSVDDTTAIHVGTRRFTQVMEVKASTCENAAAAATAALDQIAEK